MAHQAGWSHRAYWGENAIAWGGGTPERLRIGSLPASGQWVRLEVPVASLRLAPGTMIDGWAFTQHGGTVYWDNAGITTLIPAGWSALRLADGLGRAQSGVEAAGAGEPPGDLPGAIDRNGPRPRSRSSRYFVENVYSKTKEVSARAIEADGGRAEAEGDRAGVPPTMVFREMPASPSRRSCSSGASTTSGVRKWAGACRPSCRRCRRAPVTAWAWPVAGRADIP